MDAVRSGEEGPPLEPDASAVAAYYERRAVFAHDPRSVTLSEGSRLLERLGVWLKQRWLFRRLKRRRALPLGLAVDLGCGNGDWTVRLASMARQVVAVDISEGMVTYTRDRLYRVAPRGSVDVSRANLASFDVPAGADLIVAGACVQHLGDDELRDVVVRAARALSRSGLLYIRTTVARTGRWWRRNAEFHAVYRAPSWYEDVFAAAGLAIVDAAATWDAYPWPVRPVLRRYWRGQRLRNQAWLLARAR